VRGELIGTRLCCCVVLEGKLRYTINEAELIVEAGDFVLIPSMSTFLATSFDAPAEDEWQSEPALLENGEHRNGSISADADVRTLVGFCRLTSPDSALLLTLLPKLVHIRGDVRLSALVQLVIDESRAQRPAREEVLARLLEVLLIEALRSSNNAVTSPGLLRGLADIRLANAIRCIHETRKRHGPLLCWRKHPHFPARPFLNDSAKPWVSHRWTTCCRGGWQWQEIFLNGTRQLQR